MCLESNLPFNYKLEVEPNFYLPSPKVARQDDCLIGWVRQKGKNLYRLYLPASTLKRHVSIFGATGTGKSTTAARIILNLLRLKLPVLILDWHSEYRRLVIENDGYVFTPGLEISPFCLNPLDASLSRDLSEHISLVTDIFTDIYSLTPPQSFMLREAIKAAYRKKREPILADVVQHIERLPTRSIYDNETKQALLRRLRPLTEGQASRALNGPSTISLKFLLSNTVAIELGHFKEMEIRRIFVSIFLKLLFDHRMRIGQSEKIEHVTVIEEARNIIPLRPIQSPPSIGERMIAELRKFGESFIIVSQFPSQISLEVIKNSATCIVHQLRGGDDKYLLREILGLTSEQLGYLSNLNIGEAVIKSPITALPVLVYIEPVESLYRHMSNEELHQKMCEKLSNYVEFL